MEGGGSYSRIGWSPNPALPHRLDSGSEVTFYVPLGDIQKATTAFGGVYQGRVRGRLDLASGESTTSEWVAFPPVVEAAA